MAGSRIQGTAILPPNPCLIGIVLVIKTTAASRYVFHYPEHPGKDRPRPKTDLVHSSEEGESSSSDHDDYSSLDDGNDRNDNSGNGRAARFYAEDVDESGSPEKDSGGPLWGNRPLGPVETGIFGLPYGIKEFLSPPRICHKKRFEMAIDELTFLGRPVFSREDGEWKRKRKTVKREKRRVSVNSKDLSQKGSGASKEKPTDLEDLKEEVELEAEQTTGDEATTDNEELIAEKTSALSIDTSVAGGVHNGDRAPDTPSKEKLLMFNAVFVMQPPPQEHLHRISEMYDNVVRNFSKALSREQKKFNYVMAEAEKMREYEDARDHAIDKKIQNSFLAKAIATLYSQISTSRIAHLNLTPSYSISLQIPLPTSISVLPNSSAPQFPGLWLTTATFLPSAASGAVGEDDMDKEVNTQGVPQPAHHFALLLISDLAAIKADITATDSPIAGPLLHYLEHNTPRKSFVQISQICGMPLPDILYLASHLIYWRRARSVPPLHQKDTYIVSPNADMKKLKSACRDFAKAFPLLPGLPKILAQLSHASGPRPYYSLIPTPDHKIAYMDVLAWLMRGGWVTQLRTFAWVKVNSTVREMVQAEIEAESKSKGNPEENADKSSISDRSSGKSDEGRRTRSTSASDPGSEDRRDTLLLPSSASYSSHSSSASTAIPQPSQPYSTQPPPIFILNPTRAGGLESRYLSAISAQMHTTTRAQEIRRLRSSSLSSSTALRNDHSEARHSNGDTTKGDTVEAEAEARASEVVACWEKCLGYFNGRHALEKIAVREGWKRKKVADLLARWKDLEVLVVARHW
ncbi:Nitrogen permease regulator 3 [Agyrium rufum]|nr:Nitrogen permease regulator 3 [Agyrium rufum]